MPVRENSSIPLSWDLGSGNNTNTEPPHTPPLPGFRVNGTKTSLSFGPREGLQVRPPSSIFQWPVLAACFDMSVFPRIFTRGEKQ